MPTDSARARARQRLAAAITERYEPVDRSGRVAVDWWHRRDTDTDELLDAGLTAKHVRALPSGPAFALAACLVLDGTHIADDTAWAGSAGWFAWDLPVSPGLVGSEDLRQAYVETLDAVLALRDRAARNARKRRASPADLYAAAVLAVEHGVAPDDAEWQQAWEQDDEARAAGTPFAVWFASWFRAGYAAAEALALARLPADDPKRPARAQRDVLAALL
jgi:hypothetical protein